MNILLLPLAVMCQEYSFNKSLDRSSTSRILVALRTVWVLSAFVLTMSYVGNLKVNLQ